MGARGKKEGSLFDVAVNLLLSKNFFGEAIWKDGLPFIYQLPISMSIKLKKGRKLMELSDLIGRIEIAQIYRQSM